MDVERFKWLKGCGWRLSSILRASQEELDRLCAAGRRSPDPVGPLSGIVSDEIMLPHKGGLVPVVVTGNWLPYDPGDWESPPDGGYYEDVECWIRRRSGWITLRQLTPEQEQWLHEQLPEPEPYFREPDYDNDNYDYPLPKWL